MATLYITEFSDLGQDAQGRTVPVADTNLVTTYQSPVTYTTSTASAAFNSHTKYVRVASDATAFLKFGSAPTATTSGIRIAADSPEYFAVRAGHKVAAYDGSS